MRDAGFDTLPLAIESGSDYMLNKVIKKPLVTRKIGPVVESLHKYDIFVQGYFVIGLPGEREIDRLETVKVIKDAGIDWSGFSLASPVRGSELFQKARENGWVKEEDLKLGNIQGNRYILNSGKIECTTEELIEKSYFMNLDVNFVNNRSMSMVITVQPDVFSKLRKISVMLMIIWQNVMLVRTPQNIKEIEDNNKIKNQILVEDENFGTGL